MNQTAKISLGIIGTIFVLGTAFLMTQRYFNQDCGDQSDCFQASNLPNTFSITGNNRIRGESEVAMISIARSPYGNASSPSYNRHDTAVSKQDVKVEALASTEGKASSSGASSGKVKPRCRRWYKVKKGETQWSLGSVSIQRGESVQTWLRSMRWISNKPPDDDTLRLGELICIAW